MNRLLSRRARVAASIGALVLGPTVARAQQIPHTLDTISTVASRTPVSDSARRVQVIRRDDIRRMAAHNVNDVLATALGVDVDTRSPAQADVSIRGSSPDQIVVLVDGVRMTDAQSSHYTMDLGVPLASIERIEIIRGEGSALYGPDAVGGVINIVTDAGPGRTVRMGGGSFGTVNAGLAGATTHDALTTGASADFEKSDGHRDGTDYRMGQARGSVATPLGAGAFRADLALGIRDFGAAEFYAPYNSIERTTTTTLDSRYDIVAGAWGLGFSASTRRHKDHYVLIKDQPAVYQNFHESWQTDAQAVARRPAGPLGLALGTEAEHDQLSSNALGGRREWRTALFAEASGGSGDAGQFHAGVRGDHSTVYGGFFSPSLSATARAASWLRVHGSAGSGFRAPTWTERFYSDPSNLGTPDLAPERFWSGDAGATVTNGGLSLDVTGFARRATNLIDWVRPSGSPATAVWQAMNVGTATYRGVETELRLPRIHGVAASLYGSGLSVHDEQGTGLEGKYALRPITRQIGARATTPSLAGWSLRVDASHERRASEPGHLDANVRLGWTHGRLGATLDAMNLLNDDWLDASGAPAAGRGVYIGFALR
jgi:iron complex outermembrane receptor protein